MNDVDSYSSTDEALDAGVTEFLGDLDIALGNDYHQPGRQLFPQFSPQYQAIASGELLLFEKLARAYSEMEDTRKPHAKLIVQKAQVRCARAPLGLRRSLVCLDLAHEIDTANGSEQLYSDMMLRPNDADELSEWLWQLVRRWQEWNVKVVGTPQRWETAIQKIAPKGILELLSYFHAQNASDDQVCWGSLRRIALKRIEEEQGALIEVGYDPDMVKERIASLMLPPEQSDDQLDDICADPHQNKNREALLRCLRPNLQRLSPDIIKEEIEWTDRREAA